MSERDYSCSYCGKDPAPTTFPISEESTGCPMLSDEELAALKDYCLNEKPGTYCEQRDMLKLIARLERAEKSLELAKAYGRGNPYLEASDVARERDQALKCLAEAPEPEDVHDCCGSGFMCMGGRQPSKDYKDWYHSPARQNLLKGVK